MSDALSQLDEFCKRREDEARRFTEEVLAPRCRELLDRVRARLTRHYLDFVRDGMSRPRLMAIPFRRPEDKWRTQLLDTKRVLRLNEIVEGVWSDLLDDDDDDDAPDRVAERFPEIVELTEILWALLNRHGSVLYPIHLMPDMPDPRRPS